MDVSWVVPLSIGGEECPQVSHGVDEAKQTRMEVFCLIKTLEFCEHIIFPFSGRAVNE